jgi:hypothetical protein
MDTDIVGDPTTPPYSRKRPSDILFKGNLLNHRETNKQEKLKPGASSMETDQQTDQWINGRTKSLIKALART